jgi:hypothetical protein
MIVCDRAVNIPGLTIADDELALPAAIGTVRSMALMPVWSGSLTG